MGKNEQYQEDIDQVCDNILSYSSGTIQGLIAVLGQDHIGYMPLTKGCYTSLYGCSNP